MTTKNKTSLRLTYWILTIGAILGIGITYFPLQDPSLDFWSALYYTVSLFVFAHYLPEFPKTWPLILIYFAAPALSLSVVGTALRYLFRHTPSVKSRWMSKHVVICGVGRTGKLIAAALKDKGYEVVGVDMGPIEKFEEWVGEKKIPMIYGDFMSRVMLARAGAHRARSLFFASGDDLLNLEGVVGAYEWLQTEKAEQTTLWAHVANENLARTVKSTFSESADIRIFDTYHIAAEEMIHRHFPRGRRSKISRIVLLGFGKFGRDLFEVLVSALMKYGEIPDFEVFDMRDKEADVRMLTKSLKYEGRVVFAKSDINTMTLENTLERAYFLCTDDDIGNLSAALMLTERSVTANIFVRMAKWPMPAIDKALHEKSGITFININELVEANLIELIESDTFRGAAREMVARHFNAAKRADVGEIVVSGFGRFGRDLFRLMLDDLRAHGQAPNIRIVDLRDYATEVRELAVEFGFENLVTFEQADSRDKLHEYSNAQAYFLCCDREDVNLTLARELHGARQNGRIFLRVSKYPSKLLKSRAGNGRERPLGFERLVSTKVIQLLQVK